MKCIKCLGQQITFGESDSHCEWCLKELVVLNVLEKENGAKILVCDECKEKLLQGDVERELRLKDWVRVINSHMSEVNSIGQIENINGDMIRVGFMDGVDEFHKDELKLI